MKKKILLTLLITFCSCTTPYSYQTNSFNDIIVIEATVTNEYRNHEIKISRTQQLEQENVVFEKEAVIYISDDLGNEFNFDEKEDIYVSVNKFQVVPNRVYQLHITLKDGRSYISTNESLTTINEIESLNSSLTTKNNVLGISINVNNYDQTNKSKFYRYEYEETYKIIAPRWYPIKAITNLFPKGSDPKGEITFEDRVNETRTCYSTQKSNEIILKNTTDQSEDRVVDFPIRFIESSNYIISERYSILVKQYVQNIAAYNYYKTLQELSSIGSILSQTQSGFIFGNIRSINNPNEKIIGFFDVSSYTEKRLFLNFDDLLLGEPKPKYKYDCPNPSEITKELQKQYLFSYCFDRPDSNFPSCQGNLILDIIASGTKVYYPAEDGYYLLYPVQCGDCTSFSSNKKPSFWID